jgi:hypothetical protein
VTRRGRGYEHLRGPDNLARIAAAATHFNVS